MIRQLHRILVPIFLLCLSPFAVAQNAQVQGQVTDASGALIPKATVRAVNQQTGTERKVVTNNAGIYAVPFLEPSVYKIFVQAAGFSTAVSTPITLNVGQNAVLNFKLEVGAESQSVTVDGNGTLLNTTDASVSTVVDQKFVATMPLNGRSLQSLISLAPGVVQTPIPYGSSSGSSGEFSVNGQRTEGNYYTVDGVSANVGTGTNGTYTGGAAGLTPGQTALGTTQNMASIDALQEFRITTSTYSAEYGRTPGGQISLQTRSGTDQLHGTAFDYFRNDALDANNWFNDHTTPVTRKTSERQNDFGGTAGGPVFIPRLYDGRRKTFFFYSYEGLRLAVPTPATTTQVPTSDLRQYTATGLQPFINAFPVANGALVPNISGLAYFTAAYSLPSQLNTHSGRIDHTLGSNTHLFGRYSDSTSSSDSRSTGNLALLTELAFVNRSVTAGVTHTFSRSMSNDARFNYTWTGNSANTVADSFGGATAATGNTFFPGISSPYTQFSARLTFGTSVGVTTALFNFVQTQVNITDTQQMQIGRHFLKFGADYRRLELTQELNQLGASISYATAQQLHNNTTNTAQILTSGTTAAEPIYKNFSAFLQDEWAISPRTTVSAGVRWDLNPPPTNGNGPLPPVLDQITNLATATLLPAGTPSWNTYYAGFAPRLGIATQLHDQRGWETVLRAGIGNFFDTGNTLGTIGYQLLGFGSSVSYSGLSLPFASSVYTLPAASTASPYNQIAVGYKRDLQLPYALQWNVTLEQALGASRSFSLGYVASAGRRLLFGSYASPNGTVNPAFAKGNGAYLITNGTWSNYNSLQAQFKQQVTHGLQVLAAMTWSHSIDDISTSFVNYEPLLKGDSDFDVRENFQIAATYDIPSHNFGKIGSPLANHWAFDVRAFSRSSAPVDVYGNAYIAGDGSYQYARPNVIAGQPLYIYGSRATIPGGRQINYSAFQSVTGALGNAPRNFVRGFGANEIDFALRREIRLTEGVRLQFRGEAFNILNHPNFGALYNTLSSGSALFGQAKNTLNVGLKNQSALYQQGGPRSAQLALKIVF